MQLHSLAFIEEYVGYHQGNVLKAFTLKSLFVLGALILASAGSKAYSKYNSHFDVQEKNQTQFLVKEGFSTRSTLSLAPAWKSTFMLEFTSLDLENFDQNNGTASLVYKVSKHDGDYLGLVTNRHVFRPSSTHGLLIYENIIRNASINSSQAKNSYELFAKGEPVFSNVSKTHDLAFIIVRAPFQTARDLEPLPLTSNCSLRVGFPLVTVGFPNLELRKNSDHEGLWQTKRWSHGVYMGEVYQMPKGPVVATTIDALRGNSGGPVINKKGELVGIMAAGIGTTYVGSEKPNQLKVHSYIVDCQATKKFIEESWQMFLNKDI